MAGFKKQVLLALAALITGGSAARQAPDRAVLARNDPTPANLSHVICKNPSYGWSPTQSITDGISYLNNHAGDGTSFGWKAGGGACTRVSCSVDSGIYVCNDNDHDIYVPYKTMATYAEYVVNYNDTDGQTACSWIEKDIENSSVTEEVTWGQVFDINGFNVIVGIAEGTSC